MKKYELVVLVQWRLSQDEIDATLERVTGQLPDGAILETDVIGKKNMMYDFGGVTANNVMYIVSYYLELDPAAIAPIKKKFSFLDNIERYFFYAMDDNQPFYKMDELEKELKDIREDEEEWEDDASSDEIEIEA